jgi:hypothetical protein
MTWEGDAGSRQNLLNLFSSFKNTQNIQIQKEKSSELIIPSRGWSIKVWVRNMEVAWDYQSVTYPYRIQFEVDEDFGQITSGLNSSALDRLASGISWNSAYAGIGPEATYTGTSNPVNLPVPFTSNL